MAANKIDLSQFSMNDQGVEYEYETRLKVDRITFSVLYARVASLYEEAGTSEQTDYYVQEDNHRYTTHNNRSFTKIAKHQLQSIRNNDIKYSLSTETRVQTLSMVVSADKQRLVVGSDQLTITQVRKKTRIMFTKKDVAIHLTQVRNADNVVTSFEVEVEADPSRDDFNEAEFNEVVDNVYNDNLGELSSVIQYMNISPLTNFDSLHRPVDLSLDDILSSKVANAIVSKKPDGEQRFLVISNGKAWFVFPGIKSVYLGKKDLKDCVVAGELVLRGNIMRLPQAKNNMFIPFDMLYTDGQNTMALPYRTRVKTLKKALIAGSLEFSLYKMKIEHKPFRPCTSMSNFFTHIDKVISSKAKYQTDGLILAPDGGFKEGIIYKWKPVQELTIDAELRKDKYYLSYYDKQKNKVQITPYDSETANLKNDIIFKNPSGYPDGIIEFEPMMDGGELVTEDNKVVLVSKRPRPDKMYPNKVGVASRLHKLIVNPITEETIRGQNTVLMRKYHNKLKRRIFNTDRKSYLIDIGSGKGGDISKWNKFERVLAVEPNPVYIEELERRKSQNPSMGQKIKVIEAASEDTQKIVEALDSWRIGDATVYISFMFCFGFLWDPDRFDGMVNTVKAINEKLNTKCKILYITLDGSKVEDLFAEAKSDNVTLNTISMTRVNFDSMEISIEDSKTVTEPQTEFLVYPKDLFQRIGYVSIPKYPQAMGMSQPEQKYTNLLVYGEANFQYDPSGQIERLPVSSTEAIRDSTGKIRMKGEDRIESVNVDFARNMFRIATLDQSMSEIHSVLKLSSRPYRDAVNPQRQVQMAQEISQNLPTISLTDLAKKFKLTIKVAQQNMITDVYNPDQGKTVFMYQHGDHTYEPLAQKTDDGSMCLVFS
jgi:hypothetical protein